MVVRIRLDDFGKQRNALVEPGDDGFRIGRQGLVGGSRREGVGEIDPDPICAVDGLDGGSAR